MQISYFFFYGFGWVDPIETSQSDTKYTTNTFVWFWYQYCDLVELNGKSNDQTNQIYNFITLLAASDWALWSESCVLIGYPSRQDGPVLLAGIAYLDLEQEKHYVERTY